MPSPIFIKRRIDGSYVEADVVADLQPSDFLDLELTWFPERCRIVQELISSRVTHQNWPESLHWRWNDKLYLFEKPGTYATGVRLDEQWQGVMILQTLKQLQFSESNPLAYIEFAEIAPWNWAVPAIGQLGQYAGIGSELIRYAVAISHQLGYQGRVGLHSLPKAEAFYTKLGLTNYGPDPKYDNLCYFELSVEAASNFPPMTL